MAKTFFKPGDWNAMCFQCGRIRKASEMRKHWKGYYVCKEHWEARHPQDFVRGVVENPSTPWSQPVIDQIISECNPDGQTAIADYGLAECAKAEYISPFWTGYYTNA